MSTAEPAIEPTAEPPDDGTPREAITLRRFLSDTVIYGLVGISDKAIGFLLIPVTTRLLTEADFGVMSLFGNATSILFILFSMGSPTSLFRFYAESRESGEKLAILSTCFWYSMFFCAVGSLLLALFYLVAGEAWDRLFGRNEVQWMLLLAAITTMQVIESLAACRLQADGKQWLFFGIMMVSTLSTRGIGIVLMFMGHGVWGWVLGEFVGNLATVALMALTAYRGLSLRIDRKVAREALPYGAALVPASLSHWAMTASDKFLLAFLLPPAIAQAQVGIFSLGERISSIMQLINMAFILGWRRFAFHNMHHENGPVLLARGLTLIVLTAGYASLGLALLGDDLIHWFIPARFDAAMAVVPPLTFAALLWGISDMVCVGLHKAKQTARLSVLNIFAAGANIALNFALIPQYGIMGAACATLLCQLGKTALLWNASQRAFPIPLEYRRLLIAASVFVGVFYLGRWFGHDRFGWTAETISQTIFYLLVPLFLFVLGFFTTQERQMMCSLYKKGLNRGSVE